jgi:hypothetical protein
MVLFKAMFSNFRAITPTALSLIRIKRFNKTENIDRGFCGTCGSVLFWHSRGEAISIATGSLDPLYLIGEGADSTDDHITNEGIAGQIFSGRFDVEFLESEIKASGYRKN